MPKIKQRILRIDHIFGRLAAAAPPDARFQGCDRAFLWWSDQSVADKSRTFDKRAF